METHFLIPFITHAKKCKILLHRDHVSVPTYTHTALDKYNRKESKLPAHQH